MEPIWTFAARNREVLINGLDLLSFIFITPELIRIMAPMIGGLSELFIRHALAFTFFAVSVLIMSSFNMPWFVFYPVLAAIVIITYKVGFELTIPSLQTWISTVVSRSAFVLGIITFLLSRILALTIAVHELHR